MSAMASQIASLTIVNSTVYSGADQRKHQSSASLAFVQGIHRWIPRTNGQLRGKCFHFMTSLWSIKRDFHLAHVFRVIYKSLEQTIMKSAACQLDRHCRLSSPFSVQQTICPDIFHRSLFQNTSNTPLYHQGRSVLKWSAPHETSTFESNKNVTIVYNGFVSRSGKVVQLTPLIVPHIRVSELGQH